MKNCQLLSSVRTKHCLFLCSSRLINRKKRWIPVMLTIIIFVFNCQRFSHEQLPCESAAHVIIHHHMSRTVSSLVAGCWVWNSLDSTLISTFPLLTFCPCVCVFVCSPDSSCWPRKDGGLQLPVGTGSSGAAGQQTWGVSSFLLRQTGTLAGERSAETLKPRPLEWCWCLFAKNVLVVLLYFLWLEVLKYFFSYFT